MKYKLLILSFCFSLAAVAQNVGVGTTAPAAKLDVTSTNSGILIPRVALTGSNDVSTVPSPVTSTLIYNTAAVTGAYAITPGFYYWSGSQWLRMIDNSSMQNIYNTDGTLAGNRTVAMGTDSITFNSGSGNFRYSTTTGSVEMGNAVLAAGANSASMGVSTTALSYAEMAVGAYNTGYTPSSTTSWRLEDRLFGIGNGTSASATSDAFVVLKNGNVGIGSSDPGATLQVNGSTQTSTFQMTNGSAANYLLQSDASGNGTWVNPNTIPLNNIYNSNGTLSGTRTVTMGADSLTFSGTGHVITTSDATVNGLTVGIGAGSVGTNTALGAEALHANTTGSYNTASGYLALNSNLTGSQNVAYGDSALYSNTASYNAAIGPSALVANTTGTINMAFGFRALHSNTIGSDNLALGYEALLANDSGGSNVAIGSAALMTNTTGNFNIGIGGNALFLNTTGVENLAIGISSIQLNTTGSFNEAMGSEALFSNTSGTSNIAIGRASLFGNTTGNNNVAIGNNALSAAGALYYCVAIGYSALLNNTALGSVAIGDNAMYYNTSGYGNTAIGFEALENNITGGSNTAVGTNTLIANTGNNNTANGYNVLASNTSGNNNTGFGSGAGSSITTGSGNTFLGYSSTASSGTVTNATAIGANAYVAQSNSLVLGAISGVNGAVAGTYVGIGTTTPANALEVVGNTKTTNFQMTSGAAANYVLQSDGGGNATWVNPNTIATNNIYNSDGTLTVSRTVTMGADSLTFSSTTGHVITTADAVINGITVGVGGGSNANNVAAGLNALPSNTGGYYNIAIGPSTLFTNTNGADNIALGWNTMYANTTGYENTAVGWQSLGGNTTGYSNTAYGSGALGNVAAGNNNTGVGSGAGGVITSGTANTFLGYISTGSATGLTNATAIGANAYVTQSNSLILGSINGTNSATASTKVGIGNTAPAYPLDVSGQIRGNQAGGGNASAIIAAGPSSGTYAWDASGAGTDQKWWDAIAGSGGALAFRAVNDANSSATTWLQVNRGTGATISSVGFPAGNVAIGAGSTTFPLDVTTTVSASTSTMSHTDEVNGTSYGGFTYVATNGAGNLAYVGSDATYAMSIRSAGGIMAPTYFATSDRRIKDVTGTSCSDEDLHTLMGIQITDYTMRDRVANGNAHYKKVIAQQVKEVYPQAVNTSHAPQYIPNIYQGAAAVSISGDEISIVMPEAIKADRDIAIGKRCRLFLSEKNNDGAEREIKGEITAISGQGLTVKADDLSHGSYDAAFIYGTEINDLLTVDYDAISMLNVSATQELYRIIKTQKETIAAQQGRMGAMESDIDKLKASVETLQQIMQSKAQK